MNPFDYAIKMEKDGEACYRELAEACSSQGLKTIWTKLADDEVKHREIFQKMEAGENPLMIDSAVLTEAVNIFKQIAEAVTKQDVEGIISQIKSDTASLDKKASEEALYEKALRFEKKTEEFYRQKAEEVKNPQHKDLFLKIAKEEKKHCFLVDRILNFMRTPQTWLENAEFNHLVDYGNEQE